MICVIHVSDREGHSTFVACYSDVFRPVSSPPSLVVTAIVCRSMAKWKTMTMRPSRRFNEAETAGWGQQQGEEQQLEATCRSNVPRRPLLQAEKKNLTCSFRTKASIVQAFCPTPWAFSTGDNTTNRESQRRNTNRTMDCWPFWKARTQ